MKLISIYFEFCMIFGFYSIIRCFIFQKLQALSTIYWICVRFVWLLGSNFGLFRYHISYIYYLIIPPLSFVCPHDCCLYYRTVRGNFRYPELLLSSLRRPGRSRDIHPSSRNNHRTYSWLFVVYAVSLGMCICIFHFDMNSYNIINTFKQIMGSLMLSWVLIITIIVSLVMFSTYCAHKYQVILLCMQIQIQIYCLSQ